MDWEMMNNSWPLNQESLKRTSKRGRTLTAEEDVVRKLFPVRYAQSQRRINIECDLLHQLYDKYSDQEAELIAETWKLFNKRWRYAATAPQASGLVASAFIRNKTPEKVLRAVVKMVQDESTLDAVLQLTRCPVWLDKKIKEMVVMLAIDEDAYAVAEASRLDYMGEYKRFKREVELY